MDQEKHFSQWLNDFELTFSRLLPRQRAALIDVVIHSAHPWELAMWEHVIPELLQRDFISLLPVEVSLRMLRYLDAVTLCRVGAVCKAWRRVVCGASASDLWKKVHWPYSVNVSELWRRSAALSPSRAGCNLLSVATRFLGRRRRLSGQHWQVRLSIPCSKRVTSLDWKDNLLAFGCLNRQVSVWHVNASVSVCQQSFEAHTTTSLRLYGDEFILSASGDCTIATWNWQTGTLLKILRGHTCPVLCVELCKPQLVISGASNGELKVWDVVDSQCLMTAACGASLVQIATSINCQVHSSADHMTIGTDDIITVAALLRLAIQVWHVNASTYTCQLIGTITHPHLSTWSTSFNCRPAIRMCELDIVVVSGSDIFTVNLRGPDFSCSHRSLAEEGRARWTVSCLSPCHTGVLVASVEAGLVGFSAEQCSGPKTLTMERLMKGTKAEDFSFDCLSLNCDLDWLDGLRDFSGEQLTVALAAANRDKTCVEILLPHSI